MNKSKKSTNVCSFQKLVRKFVNDQKTGEKLKLKLLKIHRERLAHLGNGRYFVCADFNDENGTRYDIDIFMTGT